MLRVTMGLARMGMGNLPLDLVALGHPRPSRILFSIPSLSDPTGVAAGLFLLL